VEIWATGWALSRGTPAPVPTEGAFRIEVGLPQHKARYIFPQCSGDVRRLAETLYDPEVFIKVCAPPEPVQELLPSHWKIDRIGFMMTHRFGRFVRHLRSNPNARATPTPRFGQCHHERVARSHRKSPHRSGTARRNPRRARTVRRTRLADALAVHYSGHQASAATKLTTKAVIHPTRNNLIHGIITSRRLG
jgi:hypothetical protein